MQKTMNDFKKCSAMLKGETEDSSIQSPLFEMNRLSTLLYHYTGLVKVGYNEIETIIVTVIQREFLPIRYRRC